MPKKSDGKNEPKTEPVNIEHKTIDTVFLLEYPGNPRRIFRRIQELGDGMRRDGQLEPLIVREAGIANHYEVADGVRRLRAARLVGIPGLRVEVRPLTDRQMVELAFAANGEREDLHPLEEAEGYRQLHEVYGATVAEIAAQQAVQPARVYGRLALCSLIDDVRKAFEVDAISTAAALQFARLGPNVQRKAWEHFAEVGVAVTESEVKHYLARTVLLPMKSAPFDIKDAKLVESAGSCVTCPKRTENQAKLFETPETDSDSCTDPACWTAKRDARLVVLRAQVATRNGTFIPWPASQKFFAGASPNLAFAAGQLEVDKPNAELGDGSPLAMGRRLDALVGESVYARSTLVVDVDGNPRWLIAVEEARNALRESGHVELSKRLRAPTAPQAAEADDATKKTKRHVAGVERVLVAMVAELSEPPPLPCPSKDFWAWILLAIVRLSTQAAIARVHTRRLGQVNRKVSRQDMERELLALRARGMSFSRALAVELMATHDAYQPSGKLFTDAVKLFGLPFEKLMAGDGEDEKKPRKKKRKKGAKKAAKKSTAKGAKKPVVSKANGSAATLQA